MRETHYVQGLSSRDRSILAQATRQGQLTITGRTVSDQIGLTLRTANRVLERLAAKGWLQRGKRGVYLLVPLAASTTETAPEDPWALAMEIFEPCYISGFSAAEHWGLTEQVFNSVVVFSVRPQRRTTHEIAGVTFRVHHLPEADLFGTRKVWHGNRPVLVADPHRTLVDVLDLPELGGGGRHLLDIARAYWSSNQADPDAVLRYAVRLGRGVICKRLGFTAELFGNVGSDWVDACRKSLSAGISKLDPHGLDTGKIVSRWRLRINVPIEEHP